MLPPASRACSRGPRSGPPRAGIAPPRGFPPARHSARIMAGRNRCVCRCCDCHRYILSRRQFSSFVSAAAMIAAQYKMNKTLQPKTGQVVNLSESLKFNIGRARARAITNELLNFVSPGEAGQRVVVSSCSAAWSAGPSWRSAAEYRASGRGEDDRARAVATDEAAEYRQAAQSYAARAATAAAGEAARAAGNGAALVRLHRLAEWGGAGVEVGRGGALVVAPVIGAAAMVAASSAAVGVGDVGRRAALVRAGSAAKRSIGKGWHAAQATRAQVVYRGLLAEETRARAAALLRGGLLGRASARAARIGWAMGRRWLRRNSRREALAISEVGAAAGVDDLQAGDDWAAELQSIAAGVHLRAAAYGTSMVAAPHLACAAIVARGFSGGVVASLRLAVLGRGRRVDGLPVVEWTRKGRQVAADSIGTIGRGCVWLWAARQAGRELHSARYGRDGRDGREVAADWSVMGRIQARPLVVAPTRRPSVVQAARDSLALGIWSARKGVEVARRAAMAAVGPVARIAMGSALGSARSAFIAAVQRAEIFGAALRGESIPDHVMQAWMSIDTQGRAVMTAAGRAQAKRTRAAMAARMALLVPVARAAARAGALAGDEVAESDSVAPSSLMQSACADLRAALA